MKRLLAIVLLMPLFGIAHPGIGIVKDSKGNIYYSDLTHVWKITNGVKKKVVADVHTHELYIDNNDNLHGQGEYYDDRLKKFYHYLWVYRSNGKLDTVMKMKEAYVQQDFSLARDRSGTEYYIKQFIAQPDTTHIYRKSPGREETILAIGNFKGVTWLHPQDDGSVYYVSKNSLYSVDPSGNIHRVKDKIANAQPSFKFSGTSQTVWGVWRDRLKNIYVAVFSDQVVRKIDTLGNMSDVYQSKGDWAPLHGVFDNDNKLWIMEGSDKNEVRVTKAETVAATATKTGSNQLSIAMLTTIVAAIIIGYLLFRNFRVIKRRRLQNEPGNN